VWQLYARTIERCGPTPTLLEWDDHIPSFDEVHAEALKANRYLHRDSHQSRVPLVPILGPGKPQKQTDESRDLHSEAVR
jgi:hypothetical protein